MRKLSSNFVLNHVYTYAALIESCVESRSYFREMPWDDAEFLQSLVSFSKSTVLHYFIFNTVTVHNRIVYRDNADLYEDAPETINEIESLLDSYEIEYSPFDVQTLDPLWNPGDGEDSPFVRWLDENDDSFQSLWNKVTEEVFFLLFGNRTLLLNFNLALTEFVRDNKVALPAASVTPSGTIRRAGIPKWVGDAVYYRDHGRCVFCHADLSGLLALDRLKHFDHMVALAAGGINDPTNIQLCCESCNLKKSDGEAATGSRYPLWWRENS